MTLREALQQLDSFDSDSGLFVRVGEPLSLDTTVTVAEIPEEDDEVEPAVQSGTKLLMDVWHVADTLRGLEQLLNQQLGRSPTQDELLERFMIYLKNDA